MENKVVNYAVGYNDKKEPIKAFKVLTLTKESAKEIVKKVQDYEHEQSENAKQELALRNEQLAKKESRIENLTLCIAYLLFNQYVELGKCETTQEFENMFQDYLLNNVAFDMSLAPSMFKNVLERLS